MKIRVGQFVNPIDNLSASRYTKTMIPRTLEKRLKNLSRQFPAIAVLGPRQSGKTTLVRKAFPKLPYVSLEDLDTRSLAESDPRGFLNKYKEGAIFDEIQRTPDLFSYLQGIIDESKKNGRFILTGSQHFLLLENISQTLAGRVALLQLLPFSFEEIQQIKQKKLSLDEILFKGGYPPLYAKKREIQIWTRSYIQTYLEKDVRQIKNIDNLKTFQRFLRLCAARIGQLVNLSSLANECGITHNTAKTWLSILETSFIIFLSQPYYKNFNKRLVKAPKLYFYDTAILCALLEIETVEQLNTHYLRGNLFENFAVTEIMKYHVHRGMPANLYFWRDKVGHEIDIILEKGGQLIPIEIKSGQTIVKENSKNLLYWYTLTKTKDTAGTLIYGGQEEYDLKWGKLISWKNISPWLEARQKLG